MSELDPKDIKLHPAEDDAYDAPVDDRIIGRALLISLAVLALVFVAALGVWLGTRSEPMPVAVEEQPLQPPQPALPPPSSAPDPDTSRPPTAHATTPTRSSSATAPTSPCSAPTSSATRRSRAANSR